MFAWPTERREAIARVAQTIRRILQIAIDQTRAITIAEIRATRI